MRKCCCCIPVNVGAVILGVLGIISTAVELVFIIPYIIDSDNFNPIRENLNQFYFVFEKLLREQEFSQVEEEEIISSLKEWLWTVLLVETCLTGVYFIFSLSMVIGVISRSRWLMIPYLVWQMILIVIFILCGIGFMVTMFFLSVVMGAIWVGILLISAFLFIYFWIVVQKSYIEIKNRDYLYSPAPVKPIYNPSDHKYQPSAPQQFAME